MCRKRLNDGKWLGLCRKKQRKRKKEKKKKKKKKKRKNNQKKKQVSLHTFGLNSAESNLISPSTFSSDEAEEEDQVDDDTTEEELTFMVCEKVGGVDGVDGVGGVDVVFSFCCFLLRGTNS